MTYQYTMETCPKHEFWVNKCCPNCKTKLGSRPSTQCRLCGCFKGKVVR